MERKDRPSLCCITVALIALQQIDNPQLVFPTGMARGSAIVRDGHDPAACRRRTPKLARSHQRQCREPASRSGQRRAAATSGLPAGNAAAARSGDASRTEGARDSLAGESRARPRARPGRIAAQSLIRMAGAPHHGNAGELLLSRRIPSAHFSPVHIRAFSEKFVRFGNPSKGAEIPP
jgi:hypothetical protein